MIARPAHRSRLEESSSERRVPSALPVLAKGFRPFFLLASAYAVGIVPLWILVLRGAVAPVAYLDASVWHAHEMVFGFVTAVIAGFLLTAVANWTKRETLVGWPLFALGALWLAGRGAMMLAGALPRGAPAFIDGAFLPVLIIALARPLLASKSHRNLVMLALLAALFVANAVVHLDALGVLPHGAAHRACAVAIDVVVLMCLIIAGRVFPMFTRNATGVSTVRSNARLDGATVVAMAALTIADVLAVEPRASAVLAGVTAVLAALRAVHWGTLHTARTPLLWILHAGYGWLVLGLTLTCIAGLYPGVPKSLATHALTVGAIGSLTLGMMARVTLGHTGRALDTTRATASAFGALFVAAVARVLIPMLAPRRIWEAWLVSGALWAIAFLMFLFIFGRMLTSVRADSKPG